jgi:Glycoside hydrolase family 5 C-terminal domain
VAAVLALLRLRRPDHVGAGCSGGRRRPLRAAERRQRQAREAAGPRAPVSAGGRRHPRSFGFEPDTGRFELEYSARAPKGDARGRRLEARVDTEVFLPRIQYPDGYSVQARGAEVVSEPGARVLRLERLRRSRSVEVAVTPKR